jgi:hypothetical protein
VIFPYFTLVFWSFVVVSLHHGYRALGRTDEDRQKRYQGWFEGRPSEADLAGIRAST